MEVIKAIATLILVFIALSIGLKLFAGLLVFLLGSAVILIKLGLIAGAIYLIYSAVKTVTA